MTKSIDPRLADESKPEEIRRRARELAEDLPQLAKIALEAMIRDHNPDYKGTANKAGRAGMQSGNVSELTAIAKVKPGGADRLPRRLHARRRPHELHGVSIRTERFVPKADAGEVPLQDCGQGPRHPTGRRLRPRSVAR